VQDTARLWNEREVIFSQFAGAEFSWLDLLPVTQEVAGSSPVAPADLKLLTKRGQDEMVFSGVYLFQMDRYYSRFANNPGVGQLFTTSAFSRY
jgi:hypothetical protein